MLRELVKTGLASALHWSGVDSLWAQHTAVRDIPQVIGYHRVVPDFQAAAEHSIPPMLISLRMFEQQLDWLGTRYDFVSLDTLADWVEGKRSFKRPVAAITFDDGYADLYHYACPLLLRKGIPAAVFVVTGKIGTSSLQTYDELHLLLLLAYRSGMDPFKFVMPVLLANNTSADVLRKIVDNARDATTATWAITENLAQAETVKVIECLRSEFEIPAVVREELRPMTWPELREISAKGITIGSHTCTHALLTLESTEKIAYETVVSRQEAERNLGVSIDHFAYPSGAFNPAVVEAVAQAGYRTAYTICRHRDQTYPALTIPRRLWWENSCLDALGRLSPTVMSCQVNGVFDITESCSATHNL